MWTTSCRWPARSRTRSPTTSTAWRPRMNPELLRDVPLWAVALGLVGTVVVLVLVIYLLVTMFAGAVRRRRTDEPTLAELADPMLRARRGVGRFDARFDRLAE